MEKTLRQAGIGTECAWVGPITGFVEEKELNYGGRKGSLPTITILNAGSILELSQRRNRLAMGAHLIDIVPRLCLQLRQRKLGTFAKPCTMPVRYRERLSQRFVDSHARQREARDKLPTSM